VPIVIDDNDEVVVVVVVVVVVADVVVVLVVVFGAAGWQTLLIARKNGINWSYKRLSCCCDSRSYCVSRTVQL